MSLRLSMVASVLGYLVYCGQLRAQLSQTTPAENIKRYTVTGNVVNSATGEPIRRALVHLNGRGQLSAFTGPDGRFEITAVAEGQAFVSAEKPGYFDQQTLRRGPYMVPSNSINVGPGTNEIRVQLIPESRIQGRVVDEDGEPVAQVQLQVVAEDIIEGRKVMQSRGGAATNDDGVYHVDSLLPGRYFVHTSATPLPSSSWTARPGLYPAQYYPNAPDRLTAQAIEVKPGEQAEADFTLHQYPAFAVIGIVGNIQNGLSIAYQGRDGEPQWAAPNEFDPRTGGFALRTVPPGSWTVRFISNDAQGNTYYAEQDVTINGSDVSGLEVVLQPPAEIPVIVNHASAITALAPARESPTAITVPGVQVQLIPENGTDMQRFYAAPQPDNQQAPMFFRGLPPGTYRVAVQPSGPECMDSITTGSVDLTRSDLSIAPGAKPEPIVIGLRNDCGSISGGIRSENPNAQAVVVLVPDSRPSEPQTQPIMANTGFSFWNLRAGTYRVYAFSDLQGLEYANPEALNSYSGQQVTLAANQKANITLDLNVRTSN